MSASWLADEYTGQRVTLAPDAKVISMDAGLEPTEILPAGGIVDVPMFEIEAQSTDVPGPPTGWTELPLGNVMNNRDQEIDWPVAALLRQGGCFSRHSGWDFSGLVWFADGRWHERVSGHGTPRAAYSADTLEELMRTVNDEFGWN